ncbi:cupin domain-containing protein [Sphingobacteriaceae bacterium WQ 2009]|uniref:Cupin domain-containing protein n=1 Tax=Rhinopithecimicrobium faecis TaxID=2820698 RepID=A0A8T4H785_9SPHI|nr:cupin domain-containing protein [Sphingobacteriaceae bacterium WQ 2009]
MKLTKVNLVKTKDQLTTYWELQQLAQVNDHVVNMVKILGEFEMHTHEHGEKLFYVLSGVLNIAFPNAEDLVVHAGEFIVMPKGSRHKPYALEETTLIFFEAK